MITHVLAGSMTEFLEYMRALPEDANEADYKFVATKEDIDAIVEPFIAVRVGTWYKTKLCYTFEAKDMNLNCTGATYEEEHY